MTLLVLGLVLFLGVHAAQWPKGLRAGAVARMGLGPWKGLYSLASIAGFALIIIGYGEARLTAPLILYEAPTWAKHLSLVLAPIAFILLAAAYAPAGRIKAAVKHPMVLGVKVWALAHLLANGDLASVLVFGAFLAWAVGTRLSLARREKAGLASPPVAGPHALIGDGAAIVGGLAASAAFIIWLHPLWIGVAVWPGA
jgi:uncharacterized membrane protein